MSWDAVTADKSMFRFVQNGNTLGTTSDLETLTICLERQLPGEKPFITIQTDGWSCDDPEDLLKLLQECFQAGTRWDHHEE